MRKYGRRGSFFSLICRCILWTSNLSFHMQLCNCMYSSIFSLFLSWHPYRWSQPNGICPIPPFPNIPWSCIIIQDMHHRNSFLFHSCCNRDVLFHCCVCHDVCQCVLVLFVLRSSSLIWLDDLGTRYFSIICVFVHVLGTVKMIISRMMSSVTKWLVRDVRASLCSSSISGRN